MKSPTRQKYPRTPHLPWSNPTKTDIQQNTTFTGDTEVVVTEKLDGECTTIYPDGYCHARSTSYSPHRSRTYIKTIAASLNIPPGLVLVGENLQATHSIKYTNLEGYFYLFGVRQDDTWLEWDKVIEIAGQLNLPTPDVLYRGPFKDLKHSNLWPHQSRLGAECEGYVVRYTGNFLEVEFPWAVMKYVRPNHIQTDEHWLSKPIEYNQLATQG